MNESNDKLIQPTAKRRPGRPSTGQAKSAAERMRAYRARQKEKGLSVAKRSPLEFLALEAELAAAKQEIALLKERLAALSMNERYAKGQGAL
jgi:hypothetical protein